MNRLDNRAYDQLRAMKVTPDYIKTADGSVLIEWGSTRVICTVMLEEGVPPFKEDSGEGWLTAEYAMLPASTPRRKRRETIKPDGRSTEIKRLIGRSLRCVVDFKALGSRTVWIDCDVIQADGGTRTASITGAYMALALAAKGWMEKGIMKKSPVASQVAAISVGIVNGVPVLDLPYVEDSRADVDMNIVMTGEGEFVEIQGTGEGRSFTRDEMNALLDLATKGINELFVAQNDIIGA